MTRRPARLLIATAGATNAILAVTVAQGLSAETTYAGASMVAAAATLAAPLSLLAAGVVVEPAALSALSLLAGWLWVMPVWNAWSSGPAFLASAAAVLAAFAFPAVVHLVLAYPEGRVSSWPSRLLVGAAWGSAGASALLLALFRNPFFDVNCWSNCTSNVFLVANRPGLAQTVGHVRSGMAIALGAALVAVCAWRVVSAAGQGRLLVAPLAAGGALIGGGAVAHELALMRTEPEDPTKSVFVAIFLIISTGAVLLAAGLVLPLIHRWAAQRAVRRLTAELGNAPGPGSLESALRTALGDPGLKVAFWLRDARRFVDGRGQAFDGDQNPDDGTALTVRRGDETVALIWYGSVLPTRMETRIGPATRLAIENERMRVELLAQLDELRQSRRRIVELGDDERRRIERDLHDGVQQELLALSSELRATRSAAQAEEGAMAQALDAAIRQTHVALADVRELAHGVFPAILTDAGLAAAVQSLADRAAVAVSIDELAEDRFPSTVETTAYQAVAAALTRAETLPSVEIVRLSVRRERDALVVQLRHDHSNDAGQTMAFSEEVEERVRALGGRIEVEPTSSGGPLVRAVIPCA
jgi:signal transduction histidine kinase